jgi:hypothetical protein
MSNKNISFSDSSSTHHTSLEDTFESLALPINEKRVAWFLGCDQYNTEEKLLKASHLDIEHKINNQQQPQLTLLEPKKLIECKNTEENCAISGDIVTIEIDV